jgi:hypothetical protein
MLKWTTYLGKIPERSNAAIVRGVNAYGQQVVRTWAEQLADRAGLEPGAVMRLIVIKEARGGKHEFVADASAILNSNPAWQRPWQERDQSAYERDTLVKIITSHDESTCEICLEAARNGPYTLRQVKDMALKWAHFQGKGGKGFATNLLHPNCRCVYQPFTATRRLPVSVGGTARAPKIPMTARQLGQLVAAELKISIRVK